MAEGTQGLGRREPDIRPRTDADVDELSQRDPDTLRHNIEATREDMGHTLDQIEDRVLPSRIMERRTAKMRSRFGRARDKVMGRAQDARARAGDTGGHMSERVHDMQEGLRERADSAVDTIEHAPDAAMERTRGNPLGAGLVAFGLGVVAAGLLPDSERERQLVEAAMPKLEPVKEQLSESASEVGHDVADSARDAAQRTTEHAREEAQTASHEVRQDLGGEGSNGDRGPGA